VQSKKAPKKPYSTPQLNRLGFEQAALFLVGHAYNSGDPEARDLLEVMFPEPSEPERECRVRH
jgi:hypothetical protein